jgi:ATP-dependent 26S proteasome regulatory subunit
MCRKLTQNLKLAPDVDLEAIARSTEGLTGADLKALLYTAQLGSVPQRITINVPVVYMARDVMILMRTRFITRAIGRVGP